MTSYSTLPTDNQKEVRITEHKNTHKIYTTPKRQIYIKQQPIKNFKSKTKRTTNQQDIKS
jgi:hypothetical protein